MKKTASLFIHCYPPAKGGAEYLAKNFAEVLSDKYNVHVFTGRGETLDSYKNFNDYLPPETDPNIHRLELNQPIQRIFNKLFNKIIFVFSNFSPFYFGPILKYTDKEIAVIKNSKIIFGIAMPTKSFYDAYYFAKKFNKKLILIPCYHNVSYYNRSIFFQKTFDYATKIFFLTPFEKDQLLTNYRIDQHKMFQTTFCPYTKKQIANQQKKLPGLIERHQKNFDKKQITLGFIGQITLRKNLGFFKEYLDKYLADWQNRGFDLKVYLSGAKTNSSDQVETMFKEYLNKKVVTINYDFKPEDKEKEFQKIDILINPSEEESLGIVNFEAIYFGCHPVIPDSSAFASLTSTIPIYTDLDSLHQQIIKIYQGKPSIDWIVLTQNSCDYFIKSVNHYLND